MIELLHKEKENFEGWVPRMYINWFSYGNFLPGVSTLKHDIMDHCLGEKENGSPEHELMAYGAFYRLNRYDSVLPSEIWDILEDSPKMLSDCPFKHKPIDFTLPGINEFSHWLCDASQEQVTIIEQWVSSGNAVNWFTHGWKISEKRFHGYSDHNVKQTKEAINKVAIEAFMNKQDFNNQFFLDFNLCRMTARIVEKSWENQKLNEWQA